MIHRFFFEVVEVEKVDQSISLRVRYVCRGTYACACSMFSISMKATTPQKYFELIYYIYYPFVSKITIFMYVTMYSVNYECEYKTAVNI